MCGPSCQQGGRRGHLIVKTRQRNSVFLTDAKRRVSFPRVPAPAASCPRAGKSGGHAGSGRRQLRLGVAQGTGGHGDPPNQGILIDTLSLQEAKASSEIENIVTTQDQGFQLGLFTDGLESGTAKEVAR